MQSKLSTESQVFEDEVLAGAKRADEPREEMPERHSLGKNIIGTIRIQFCAKSFILQMYDVSARHRYPSRLISYTQPPPSGNFATARHSIGSTKPASRLGRDRKLRIGTLLYHNSGSLRLSSIHVREGLPGDTIRFPPLPATYLRETPMTEERKYAILFAATLVCARKLNELDSDRPSPARSAAVEDAISQAAFILQCIDRKWSEK